MADAEVEVGGHLVDRGNGDTAEVDQHAGALGLAQHFFHQALHGGAGGAAGARAARLPLHPFAGTEFHTGRRTAGADTGSRAH